MPNPHSAKLITWFKKKAREAPWRTSFPGNRNPYETWVSEIMLQQTQFKTVIPFFEKWMKLFPTLEAVAMASAEEVLLAWKGLGYYRRVRYLKKGCEEVISKYGGIIPQSETELKKISGIGDYTKGAILSLAYNQQVPLLDGNLIRIFSRLELINHYPKTKKEAKQFWDMSTTWAKHKSPGYINEALMELGALVCTKQNPLCNECPLSSSCKAYQENVVGLYPPLKDRKVEESLSGKALVWESNRKILLSRSESSGFLKGHWVFPMQFTGKKKLSTPKIPDFFFKPPKNKTNSQGSHEGRKMQKIKHSIMHFRLSLEPVYVSTPQGKSQLKKVLNNSGRPSKKAVIKKRSEQYSKKVGDVKEIQEANFQMNPVDQIVEFKWVPKEVVEKEISNQLCVKIWKSFLGSC